MATNGILKFQGTNKATFVGATSNVVIDTVKSSLGIGVDVDGPTSNLHVVGNAYVSTELTVGGTVTATAFAGDGSGLTGISTSPTLQSVTDTGNVTSNTIQFTNATTGFVTTSNIDMGGTLNMGGHILPNADNTYDIGSAAFKIRDMYVSDNSLWIGDEAKISFTGNQLKFRRRNKSVVPSGLTTLGAAQGKNAATVESEALALSSGVSTVSDMKLHHWMAYAKSLDTTKTTGDIYTDSAADYEASAASEAFKEVGDDIYSTHDISIGKTTAPTSALDVNGTVTATAFVGTMPNLDATKITTGTLDAARIPTLNQNTTGSAATLTTPRSIGGVNFDGSVDIVLPVPTTFGAATFSGDVAVDTDTLFVDTVNDRVGVNIATPAHTLDVAGDINLSGSLRIGGAAQTFGGGGGGGSSQWTTVNSTEIHYSSGNVGIGTTDPAHTLHVDGNIYASGNVTAYSDARKKTNLQIIDNSLNKIEKINGYTYEKDNVRYTGLVAQEVLSILPEAVVGNEEDGYGLAYGNMVGILVEAIKELSGKVKSLEEKLYS
ncbi:MAG: tail fiber domain-containing protein [Flavobacteriales bacterium]